MGTVYGAPPSVALRSYSGVSSGRNGAGDSSAGLYSGQYVLLYLLNVFVIFFDDSNGLNKTGKKVRYHLSQPNK